MERDFLGIYAKKSESESLPVRDDGQSSAMCGNSTVNWPFTSTSPAQQKTVSFITTQQEEKSSQFRHPDFHPNFREKALNQDGSHYLHGSQSSGLYTDETRVLPSSMNPNSFGGVPNMNTYQPALVSNRDVRESHPLISDMTIFYGGKVMVFQKVPFEKAGEIVRLANSVSSTSSIAPNPIVKNSILNPKMVQLTQNKPDQVSLPPRPPPVPSVSTEISLAPKIGLVPTTGTINESSTSGSRSDAPTPVPQAIPQARKASLSRFLEKRKERVAGKMPYQCTKKSSGN